MEFIYNDGGRSNYFTKQNVGDCCCRAICNATGLDYKRIYDLINKVGLLENTTHHRRGARSNARDGVFRETAVKIIEALDGEKIKVQEFGSNKKCHLEDDDLKEYQKGNYILFLSKHWSCLIDGKLVDTYNCSRGGDRQVYKMYKMKKRTPQQYNELITQFEKEIDKKINNKQNKQERDAKRNDRINKKIQALNEEEQALRNRLHEIFLERNELKKKIK